jgi:eukaryotic-like serine/threonine-protein kinase
MLSDLTPHLKDVIRRASERSDSDELDRFLQLRVAPFARVMAALFGVLYLAGLVIIGLLLPRYFVAVHVHPGKILNLVLALALLLVGWLLPRRPRPHWQLRALDLGIVITISVCVGVAVATGPGGYHLELAALLVVVLPLVLRSAIVPSTARFTVLVGVLCTPAIVIGGYLQALRNAPDDPLPPVVIAAGLAVWCLAATAAAALVSRVIYGLVVQVQQAMQLGRYTLRDKIGEGGMGAVYRAEHAMLRRATAIKLLLPDRVSAAALVRFEREVQLTSQLSHPNTIAIYDYGRTPDGVFYYAMELLEGRSLDRLVSEEGPQPPGRVVHVLAQVAGSLREAHAQGMIHRDIKPGNLLLGPRGGLLDFVKVIDFGLVKQLDAALDLTVTGTDSITGTPLFMAPESITHPETIDGKVDTYALGATAYFLLTGTPPFSGNTLVEVCSHQLHSAPEPPSLRLGAPVPAALESLILRCLAKEPQRRPDDDELLGLLGECQQQAPWRER